MLVLTRKVGDVIAIGDNIKIVVMAIKGKQVRLGVQADRSTVVHREEVYQKIQQEIRAAMHTDVEKSKEAKDLFKDAAEGSFMQGGSGTLSSLPENQESNGRNGPKWMVRKGRVTTPEDPESAPPIRLPSDKKS